MIVELKYYCDNKRHLVCKPYSITNLHQMARDLNIDSCFFEYSNKGRLAHYDIPKLRLKEIMDRCTIVNYREIVKIIKG
jgi:hypothetical protein